MKTTLRAALAAAAIALASPAHANLAGEQIFGTLEFNGSSANAYDPSFGFVPAAFDNASGPLVTVVQFGRSFGFQEPRGSGFNRVDANFSNYSGATSFLDLGTDIFNNISGMHAWEQTFTSVTPGLFTTLTLVSSNFAGLTYGLVGDTITLDWIGWPQGSQATFAARFIVDQGAITPPPPGVPEPAAWALMILGFGGVGAMLRRRRAGDRHATAHPFHA